MVTPGPIQQQANVGIVRNSYYNGNKYDRNIKKGEGKKKKRETRWKIFKCCSGVRGQQL